MVGRVGLKLQEVAPSRAYGPNPLDLRLGQSESPASQPRASQVIPSNPTRPARSPCSPPVKPLSMTLSTSSVGFLDLFDVANPPTAYILS